MTERFPGRQDSEALATLWPAILPTIAQVWKMPAATSVDTVWLSRTHTYFIKEKKHGAQKGKRNWMAFEYTGWERKALHRWTPSPPCSGRRRVPKWRSVCMTVHKIKSFLKSDSCKNESHQVILGSWLPLALRIKSDPQIPQLSSEIGLGFGGGTCKPASVNKKEFVSQRRKDKAFQGKRTAGKGGGQLSEGLACLKTARKLSVAGTQGVTEVRLDT